MGGAGPQGRDAGGGEVRDRRILLRQIALYTGVALLTYGFGAYFKWLPGESFSAVMLIFGFALKYAELKPIELRSTETALAMSEAEQTDIQKQVREDTTRYRYGDEQHLD